MYESIHAKELEKRLKQGQKIKIIDVREKQEFESGHIPGASSVPLSAFPVELDKTKQYFVLCQAGGRSKVACEYLCKNGYDVVNIEEGMSAWQGSVI